VIEEVADLEAWRYSIARAMKGIGQLAFVVQSAEPCELFHFDAARDFRFMPCRI
jgi:hypothetical protein